MCTHMCEKYMINVSLSSSTSDRDDYFKEIINIIIYLIFMRVTHTLFFY